MAGNSNSGRQGLRHEKALAEKQRKWREAIQVGALLNALSDHVLKDRKMDASKIRAAEVLLNKALPNLQSGELHVTGNPLAAFYDTITDQPAPRKTNGHAGNGADPHG